MDAGDRPSQVGEDANRQPSPPVIHAGAPESMVNSPGMGQKQTAVRAKGFIRGITVLAILIGVPLAIFFLVVIAHNEYRLRQMTDPQIRLTPTTNGFNDR
jgi:hypothetical protein